MTAPAEAGGPVEAAPAPVDFDVNAAREQAHAELFSEGESAAVETKPEPQKTEPEKPSSEGDEIELSKKWAKFKAQEDRLVKRQKEFASKEAELKAKLEQFESQSSLLNDPIAFLNKAGWDQDRIVKFVMGDGKVEPEVLIKQLETKHQEEIKKLREEREAERKELESTRRTRELERVQSELYSEVSHLVKGEEFSLLQKLVAKNPKQELFIQQKVGNVIREVYQRTNGETVVDPVDALRYIQQELAAIQLADPGQAPAVKSATPVAVEPKPITNSSTSQRVVQRVDYDEADPEQRRERARQILAGEIEPDEE